MNFNWLHEMIDYGYDDKPAEVRAYLIEQTAETTDNNKGFMWEHVLNKSMQAHTTFKGGNYAHMDWLDTTDAKIATFYKRKDGVWEASISNIRTKVGPLRVCLVVPGHTPLRHRVHFLFIPHAAYQKYARGSDSLKITLNAKTNNISGELTKYKCTFEEVTNQYIP